MSDLQIVIESFSLEEHINCEIAMVQNNPATILILEYTSRAGTFVTFRVGRYQNGTFKTADPSGAFKIFEPDLISLKEDYNCNSRGLIQNFMLWAFLMTLLKQRSTITSNISLFTFMS